MAKIAKSFLPLVLLLLVLGALVFWRFAPGQCPAELSPDSESMTADSGPVASPDPGSAWPDERAIENGSPAPAESESPVVAVGREDHIAAPSQGTSSIRLLHWPDFKYPHILEQERDGQTVQWVANHLIIGIHDSRAREILDQWLAAESGYTLQKLTDEVVVLGWTEANTQRFIAEKAKWSERLGDTATVEEDFIVRAMGTPSDPDYSAQHHLRQIAAPEAWTIRSQATGIVVALLDSGVDLDHPELQASIFVNPGEVPGNSSDDDGNGYRDDVRGWDFVDDDNTPEDVEGHGTAMAGIIAAAWNNGIGGAGVCEEVEILPVRFLNAEGLGSTSDEIRALAYILKTPARIVNASFGGPSSSWAIRNQYQKLRDAGVWVVAAAGNESSDNDQTANYPSNYEFENIIAVGAANEEGNAAVFSNFGQQSVDLFAPGTGIYTTAMEGSYGYSYGTSPAAAVTSGALALLLAEFPEATIATIRDRLVKRARFADGVAGLCVSDGVLDLGHSLVPGDGNVPFIVEHPRSKTVDAGDFVTLVVRFIAYGELSLQWFKDGQPIEGATASVFEFRAERDDAGDYTVQISTGFGSATSNPARVEVIVHPPVLVETTTELITFRNRPFVLYGKASGSEPMSWQWYLNGQLIPGATNSSYAVESASESDIGDYTVEVTNAAGKAVSPVIPVRFSEYELLQWHEIVPSGPRANEYFKVGDHLFASTWNGLVRFDRLDGIVPFPLPPNSGFVQSIATCNLFAVIRTSKGGYFRLGSDLSITPIFPGVLSMGGAGAIMISGAKGSIDGENWIPLNIPDIRHFAVIGTTIVSFSGATPYYRNLPSGEWATSAEIPDFGYLSRIVASRSLVCAWGSLGIAISTDGESWERLPHPQGEAGILGLSVKDGLIFAMISSSRSLASRDGRTWVELSPDDVPRGRTSELVFDGVSRVARVDGGVFPVPPSLKVVGNLIQSVPGFWTLSASSAHPVGVERVELLENNQVIAMSESSDAEFEIERDSFGHSTYALRFRFLDGWGCRSDSVTLSTGPLVESTSAPVLRTEIGEPLYLTSGPGFSYSQSEDRIVALNSMTGEGLQSFDGRIWTPLNLPGSLIPSIAICATLADGSLLLGLPQNPTTDSAFDRIGYLVPPGDSMPAQEILKPRSSSMKSQWVKLSGRAFLYYRDGEIYEYEGVNGWRFHANLPIPPAAINPITYEDFSVRSGKDFVVIRTLTTKREFVSGDLLNLHLLDTPQGWTPYIGLEYLSNDQSQSRWLISSSGEFSEAIERPGFLEYLTLTDARDIFGRDSSGNIWITQFDGDPYPIPFGDPWILPEFGSLQVYTMFLDGDLFLCSSVGEVRSMIQRDFECASVSRPITLYGSANRLQVSVSLTTRNLLSMGEGAILGLSGFLHLGDVSSPGIPLGLEYVSVEGVKASSSTFVDVSFSVPPGLPAADYVLSITVDADNQFMEVDEGNNTAVSRAFAYNPNVPISIQLSGNGWIESATLSNSMPYSSQLNYLAVPAPESEFVGWTGSVVEQSAHIGFTLVQPTRLKAHFLPRSLVAIYPEVEPIGDGPFYAETEGPLIRSVLPDWANLDGHGWAYIPNLPELPDSRVFYDPYLGWLSRIPDTQWYYHHNAGQWLRYDPVTGSLQ